MAEPNADAPAPKGEKSKKLLTILVVVGIMALEGGGIIVAMKMMGGGASTAEAGGGDVAAVEPDQPAVDRCELLVGKVRATHTKTGRVYLYSLTVYAAVPKAVEEEARTLFDASKATIEDRICRIVRSADPEHLKEDGLETLRRQIKFELDKITGDKQYVEEILIPELTPHRADY